jgi:hypothetical protein
VLALVGDDERAEVLLGLLDGLREHRDDVRVDAVGLRLEGEPEDAVAEVPRLRAVVLEDGRRPCGAAVSVAFADRSSAATYAPLMEVEDLPSL